MKNRIIPLILIGIFSVMVPVACAANNEPQAYNIPTYEDDKEITIGVWGGSYMSLNDQDAADLADAGISLFAGYHDVQQSVLDIFAAHNISVLPDERSWNGEVPSYYNHTAVKGLCVSDEPAAGEFDTLAQKHALWKQTMGDKLFYINLFPSYANTGVLGGSLDSYVSAFVSKVQPAVLSYDHYALQKDIDNPESSSLRDTYFADFDVYSHYAKQADIPLWYSLQTAGHQNYVTPTVEELRWQMAVAMTYGSQGLLHYVYSSHESGYDPMVTMQGEKTEVFDKVKTADLEVLAWDHIYMSFSWLGTTSVLSESGEENWMFNLLQYDVPIENVKGVENVTSDVDVLLGLFEDDNGNKGFMITNAANPSEKKNAEVKVTFSSEYKGVLVIENGEESIVNLKNGAADIELNAGEGKFLIPLTVK